VCRLSDLLGGDRLDDLFLFLSYALTVVAVA
jgi:hypothetical protein